MHRDIRDNHDPGTIRVSQRAELAAAAARATTFKAAAEQYIEERRPSWKNDKHAQQWERTLQTYAFPVIGDVQVCDIDKAMVLKIVKPIWNEKTETAQRL